VVRYNNTSGTTSPALYTSASPDAPRIYDLVTDSTRLYLLESRQTLPCPECLYEYNQVLLRLNKTGGAAAPLYERISPSLGNLDVLNLTTDGKDLFWQEGERVVRLPNNADALPQINMTIAHMEITQGIQNVNNSVELISAARTWCASCGCRTG
jgi:hypothetical protein